MRNENVQPLEVQPYLEEMNPIIEHECEQSKLQINQFKRILQNMGKFIKDVEKIKVDPEDSVIYKYCGAQPYLVLSSATVVDLLQKRIQKQLIDKIRMIKNKKIKRNWSEEDLKILFWVVNHYALFQKIESIQKMSIHNWESISSLIPGTTGVSCMFRILSLKKTRLSQQQWTEQQSNLLYDIVDNKEIIDWKIISEDLFLMNRSPNKIFRNAKQCKEHWSCFLNPKLRKGPWQLSQDLLLLQKIVQNNGKKRWTQLAKYFQGRTENALKNRFCLIIERAKLECTRKEELYLIETALQNLKIKKQAGLQPKKNKKSYFSPSTLTLEFESNSKIEEKKVVLEKNCRNNKIQKLNLSQDLQAITLSNNQFLSAMLAGTKFFLLFNQPNLPA